MQPILKISCVFFLQGQKQQSSGGSHAGFGGQRSLGKPYDYIKGPTLPGEGGGPPRFKSTPSAPGGGLIRVVVKDRLVNNGEISARFEYSICALIYFIPFCFQQRIERAGHDPETIKLYETENVEPTLQ